MLREGPDQEILIEAFLSLGRVDHVTMVMALHPAYLSCFLKTQHALLELDGPLPRHWRHYIAVMVRAAQSSPTPSFAAKPQFYIQCKEADWSLQARSSCTSRRV